MIISLDTYGQYSQYQVLYDTIAPASYEPNLERSLPLNLERFLEDFAGF